MDALFRSRDFQVKELYDTLRMTKMEFTKLKSSLELSHSVDFAKLNS